MILQFLFLGDLPKSHTKIKDQESPIICLGVFGLGQS
jgi:hypothetical protein